MAIPHLSENDVRDVFYLIMLRPVPDGADDHNPAYLDDCHDDEAVMLLAADLIISTRMFDWRQAQRILVGIWPFAGDVLIAANDQAKHGAWPLHVVDRRYVAWPNRAAGFLDMTTGRSVEELPMRPLESIAYDLAELFRRHVDKEARDGARDQGDRAEVQDGVGVG